MDLMMPVCHIFHLHNIMSLSNLRGAWISWTYVVALLLSVFLVAGKSLRTTGPKMLSNPVLFTNQVGETAVLLCSVSNLGEHTVTWRKLPNSAPLTIGTQRWVNDPRLHAEHVPNSSRWNLVIEDVRLTDQGQYECQVSNKKSLIRHRVTLQVTKKQEVQLPRIEISGENVIRAGTTLRLTCNASVVDVLVEKLIWVKVGHPIQLDDSNRYNIYSCVVVTGQNSEVISSVPKVVNAREHGHPIHLDDSNRYKIYSSVVVTGQNSEVISSVLKVVNAREHDSGTYLCKSTERAQMAGVKVEVQGVNMKREKQDELNLPYNEDSPLRETRDYHQVHSSSSSSSKSSSSSSSSSSSNKNPKNSSSSTRAGSSVLFHCVNIIMWVTSLYSIVFHV